MHIILGILGSLITILILLNRLADAGIDLGGLNPYLWQRRRKWRNQYEGNPVFKIDSPMDATAILMVATAKVDGDISREDKHLLLNLFENEFKLPKKEAAGLLISSAHLLGDGNEVRNNVSKFLAASKEAFTESQVESALTLLKKVAASSGLIHPYAHELVTTAEKELRLKPAAQQSW